MLKSAVSSLPEFMEKIPRRRISGILLLDKAAGISSNSALQRVRRLYRAEKAGHTGVLDPQATGLLPVCFGEAAKFSQYLLDADKAYTARLFLGAATDTGDTEGKVVQTSEKIIDLPVFQAACRAHLGRIRQTPPMYSALKHQGRPLYTYARQGIEIKREAREVQIHGIDILSFCFPHAEIAVSCSKGTYIRTLAEDIARAAGTAAHLTALRRTASAGFRIENAVSESTLAEMDEAGRDARLLPCDAMLQHLDALTLPEKQIIAVQQGKSVSFNADSDIISPFRLYSVETGAFAGLAQIVRPGLLKALRLMHTGAGAGS